MYILFCIITSARTSSTPTSDDYLLFEESVGNCSELSLLLISFALCTFKCRFTLSLSSSVMYVFEFNRDVKKRMFTDCLVQNINKNKSFIENSPFKAKNIEENKPMTGNLLNEYE